MERHYRVYTIDNQKIDVRAKDPKDAIMVALGKKNLDIRVVDSVNKANFMVELIDGKKKVKNYYLVQETQGMVQGKGYITKQEILELALEKIRENAENFQTSNPMDNPYASGVHDGILDLVKSLGIDIKESYYN